MHPVNDVCSGELDDARRRVKQNQSCREHQSPRQAGRVLGIYLFLVCVLKVSNSSAVLDALQSYCTAFYIVPVGLVHSFSSSLSETMQIMCLSLV